MSRKATVTAPSNIAFVKYWGARDLERAIPLNPSISMTLTRCTSRSTVEHVDDGGEHEIRWRGDGGALELAPPDFAERVRRHLDRLRDWAGCGGRFRVATENNFPAAAGLASSASGFAALTLATVAALGRELAADELSTLARRSGSGSAARSVLGGYVEWPRGEGEDESYAFALAEAGDWELCDVIALVATGPKTTSSLDGHRRAATTPYHAVRQRLLPERLAVVRDAIARRDLDLLGPVLEAEAIDLHCQAMTSNPPIFYWRPGTLEVLGAVRTLRLEGHDAWSTMDAGANVHVICSPASRDAVADRLRRSAGVREVLVDGVGKGPIVEKQHLF